MHVRKCVREVTHSQGAGAHVGVAAHELDCLPQLVRGGTWLEEGEQVAQLLDVELSFT